MCFKVYAKSWQILDVPESLDNSLRVSNSTLSYCVNIQYFLLNAYEKVNSNEWLVVSWSVVTLLVRCSSKHFFLFV